MSIGPVTIFDKSALESFSVDESVWFDQFFLTNVTPIFYVETLADLEKKVEDGRTPEQVVRQLATKTPIGGMPNVHHEMLCRTNLLGEEIPWRRVPAVANGRHVTRGKKVGIIYSDLPEWQAFQRWQKAQYLDLEREFAKLWRSELASIDLHEIYEIYRPIILERGRPQTLAEVKTMAERILWSSDRGEAPLLEALEFCNVPAKLYGMIRARWKATGRPPLQIFAPYAAHVATVELFFCLAIASDLIGRERNSNHIDLAYLHYLPFCMVFASNDRLHERLAPVFLQESQKFVKGSDLKADLRKLNEHFLTFPEEERAKGIWAFASRPPVDGDFLVSKLWDEYLPNWRNPKEKATSPEQTKKLLKEFNEDRAAPPSAKPVKMDDADFVMIERVYPFRRGSWQVVPPGTKSLPKR